MNLDSNIIKLFVLLNGERAMRLCVEGSKIINRNLARNVCAEKCPFYNVKNSYDQFEIWSFCLGIANKYANCKRNRKNGYDFLRRKEGIKNYLKKINDEFK